MSKHFALPGAPAELAARINARRARIPAGMVMTATERPSGVSEEEWDALGDPGKRAIVRERERAERAERALVTARSAERIGLTPDPAESQQGGEKIDIADVIAQAVAAAVAPFEQERTQRRQSEEQALITDAIRKAAEPRFHDAQDALLRVDATTVVGADGQPDPTKITAALDGLMAASPHLAKPVDTRRHYDPSNPVGGTQPPADAAEKVKEALDRMKAATGIKLAESA